MTTLTYQQIENLWVANGGQASTAAMAAAIAEAESSGRTDATNTAGNSHGTDEGLFQENTYYHPEVKNPFDANQNTQAAIRISKDGTDWDQWSTYKNGAYKKYLSDAALNPAAGTGTTLSGDVGSGASNASDTVEQTGLTSTLGGWFLDALGISDFKDAAERFGLILMGAVLILIGVIRFTDAGQQLASKVKTGAEIAAL